MKRIKTLIFAESRYKINRKRIRQKVEVVLSAQKLEIEAEVSLAFVGDRKMRGLSLKYTGEDKTRNILSFSLSEGESHVMPTEVLYLGDIVISYPFLIKEAETEEELVDDRIDMLVEHGLKHLLGLHHE